SVWLLAWVLVICWMVWWFYFFFFFQAEDGIRDKLVTGVQTCALPISLRRAHRPARLRHRRAGAGPDRGVGRRARLRPRGREPRRSEEHTSELQSLAYLVCRLLLEKKKQYRHPIRSHVLACAPHRDSTR